MAPVCSLVSQNNLVHPISLSYIQNGKGRTHSTVSIKILSCCFQFSNPKKRGWHILQHERTIYLKRKMSQRDYSFSTIHQGSLLPFEKPTELPPLLACGTEGNLRSTAGNASQVHKPFPKSNESVSGDITRHLKALDSYFSKLDESKNEQSPFLMPKNYLKSSADIEDYQRKISRLDDEKLKPNDKSEDSKMKSKLGSLENYFDKLNAYRSTSKGKSQHFGSESSRTCSIRRRNFFDEEKPEKGQSLVKNLRSYAPFETVEDEVGSMSFEDMTTKNFQPPDESSVFCLINFLASINIAVFLFEIASPVRDSNFEQLSLPLLYGAKINKLILDGEWWRLVTPMFLHSGFLHVALSCWVLLTFGPQVCRRYGPFAFFLIYTLGGICANLTSFVRTPELTVCGTGPVFAIIGAWLIDQVQNKDANAKEVSENMFWKAVVATCLSFVLFDSAQIDQWTHIGAALSGVFYGFFTCPTLQFSETPPTNGQKEGVTLLGRQADPFKALLVFAIFIFALLPLFYMVEPDLDISELDSL